MQEYRNCVLRLLIPVLPLLREKVMKNSPSGPDILATSSYVTHIVLQTFYTGVKGHMHI